MRVLALPRDRNPYQELLYGACRARGMRVRYVGELTGSHTLNMLLLPFELAALRLAGWRLLHVHWLFGFAVTGASRLPPLRRFSDLWLGLTLTVVRLCGLRLVWTAHNVLPHERIFHDDLAARRELVRAADLVIAHSGAAEDEVARTLARPRRSAVIPLGPYGVARRDAGRPPDGPLRLLFFGTVLPYKGVEDLLEAFARLADESPLELTVAGRCPDEQLRQRLERLAGPWPRSVQLRLEAVPEEELPELLGGHDVLVLPFREVTTSSTVVLGLEAGIPVLVPDLPPFEDMPVLRHVPGTEGLEAGLRELSRRDRSELERRGAAGREWGASLSWDEVAARTMRALAEIAGERESRGLRPQRGVIPH
jgi:glycosyltransferase involved in cell wall biosynthesis